MDSLDKVPPSPDTVTGLYNFVIRNGVEFAAPRGRGMVLGGIQTMGHTWAIRAEEDPITFSERVLGVWRDPSDDERGMDKRTATCMAMFDGGLGAPVNFMGNQMDRSTLDQASFDELVAALEAANPHDVLEATRRLKGLFY